MALVMSFKTEVSFLTNLRKKKNRRIKILQLKKTCPRLFSSQWKVFDLSNNTLILRHQFNIRRFVFSLSSPVTLWPTFGLFYAPFFATLHQNTSKIWIRISIKFSNTFFFQDRTTFSFQTG